MSAHGPSTTSDTDESTMHTASVTVPAAHAEDIAMRLEDAEAPAPLAVTLFERGNGLVEITAYYAEEPARDALIDLVGDIPGAIDDGQGVSIATLQNRDWVREAEALRRPVRAGRFVVHGRHDRGRLPPSRHAIEIDAGLAFGTGQHASTKGCLIALDRILKRRHPRAVLDVGTGTGVLAIAAAKVARAQAIASDIDPPVVVAARENVRLAGLQGTVRVIEAAGLDHGSLRRAKFDLIFANILMRPLLDLAPALARALAPGGLCILSGLLQSQARQVEARYRSLGFTLDSRLLLDGWAILILERRSAQRVERRGD
jgi:ribosomal protein L11 methyltransferase